MVARTSVNDGEAVWASRYHVTIGIEFPASGASESITKTGSLEPMSDEHDRKLAAHCCGARVAAVMVRLFDDNEEFDAAFEGFMEFMTEIGAAKEEVASDE
jgi:hypothetical protein